MFSCIMLISKSPKFCLLSPSVLPIVWSSPCISINCCLCHLLHDFQGVSHCMSRYHSMFVLFKPSLSTLLCQIVMYFSSYLPALFFLISWFDPFFVPRLLFFCVLYCFSVFFIDLTLSFLTLFWLSTSTHGLPFFFVALIGRIPGFDPLPVTMFMIWITFIITVCWMNDPVYGH